MASIHTRPLTAQEAFEGFGYLIVAFDFPQKIRDVIVCENQDSGVPLGASVVLTEAVTRNTAVEFCERTGWRIDFGDYFYKAVAE